MTGPSPTAQTTTDRMAATSRHSSTNVGSSREFDEYYDKAKSLGFNVRPQHPHLPRETETQLEYLSRNAQRKYWTDHRLGSALLPLPDDPKIVRSDYIGVFSLLAYCGHLDHFQDYFQRPAITDDQFPLLAQPPAWPKTPTSRKLFELVKEHQHRFFPLIFNHLLRDRTILPEARLPIVELEELRIGEHGEACVYKIGLDPEYNELQALDKDSKGNPTCNTFVLKIQSSKSCHKNELNAFTYFRSPTFGPGPSPNIVKFYGSFIQNGLGCMILEYVDGPNLLNYLTDTEPPESPTDRLLFWKSYWGLFEGLHRIHQVADLRTKGAFLGVHGDLKPENLLLKRGPTGNPYDFEPKITDFGCSDFRLVAEDGEDRRCQNHRGNPQYCAPEASSHNDFLATGPLLIDFSADIFSIGAITSEVITWIVSGNTGRETYFDLRKQRGGKKKGFEGCGNAGCFHDGISVWPLVKDQHQLVRDKLHPSDHITPKVIDLVDEHMLKQRPRTAASDLVKDFENKYEAAQSSMFPCQTTQSTLLIPLTPVPQEPTTLSGLPLTPTSDLPALTRLGCGRSIPTESSMADASPSPSPLFDRASPFQNLASPTTLDSVSNHDGEPPSPSKDSQVQSGPNPAMGATLNGRTVPELAKGPRLPDHLSNGHLKAPHPNSLEGSKTPASAVPSRRGLTLADLEHFREYKKKRLTERGPQVLDDVEDLRHCIEGRDHIFYIDDSKSMGKFQNEIKDAFRVMSYVAKQADRDGVELVFGFYPTTVFRERKTSRLLKRFQNRRFQCNPGMMQDHFDQFVEAVLIPRLARPTKTPFFSRLFDRRKVSKAGLSVIVFTDGDWGENEDKAAGVENPVMRLMKEAITKDVGDTRVMVSFVQFGDSAEGRRRLDYLDNFSRDFVFQGGQWVRRDDQTPMEYDIVDSGPVTGDIAKLLIGSIIRSNDNKETG